VPRDFVLNRLCGPFFFHYQLIPHGNKDKKTSTVESNASERKM
jgi:hypothetical protein